MKSKLIAVRNDNNKDVTDLYLHGRIGKPIFEDEETITDDDVNKQLKRITTDKIIVHLNSSGGCLFTSFAIHNLLKAHKATVEVVIDSVAASGGSVIAMAGSKIKMFENSMMFIHPAHTLTYADAKGHRKVAKDLDQMDKSLKENYSKRFKGTNKELEDLIQSATWLTAAEAKKLGFCDEIIEDKVKDEEVSNNLLTQFKNQKKSKVVVKLMKKYGDNQKKEEQDETLISKFKRRG